MSEAYRETHFVEEKHWHKKNDSSPVVSGDDSLGPPTYHRTSYYRNGDPPARRGSPRGGPPASPPPRSPPQTSHGYPPQADAQPVPPHGYPPQAEAQPVPPHGYPPGAVAHPVPRAIRLGDTNYRSTGYLRRIKIVESGQGDSSSCTSSATSAGSRGESKDSRGSCSGAPSYASGYTMDSLPEGAIPLGSASPRDSSGCEGSGDGSESRRAGSADEYGAAPRDGGRNRDNRGGSRNGYLQGEGDGQGRRGDQRGHRAEAGRPREGRGDHRRQGERADAGRPREWGGNYGRGGGRGRGGDYGRAGDRREDDYEREDYGEYGADHRAIGRDCQGEYRRDYESRRRVDDVLGFKALIFPMVSLRGISGAEGMISFYIRRKAGVIAMQWETFSGQLGATGIAYVFINQTLCNLPPHPVQRPIRLTYNGTVRLGYFEIDPHGPDAVKFYLSLDGEARETKQGDTLIVHGACVEWITV